MYNVFRTTNIPVPSSKLLFSKPAELFAFLCLLSVAAAQKTLVSLVVRIYPFESRVQIAATSQTRAGS